MPCLWQLGDGGDFLHRVEGAQLGGLRDGHGQRLCAVLIAPAPGFLVDQFGRELAVRSGDLQQLHAADPLRCAVFVHIDVGCGGADDGTPARQQ
jgi:hypothetical protein